MKNKLLYYVCISSIVWLVGCEQELEKATPVALISVQHRSDVIQPSNNCVFKYKLANIYGGMDNQAQQNAITQAVGLWQHLNKNIQFVSFLVEDRCDILVKYVAAGTISTQTELNTSGFVKFPLIGKSIARLVNGRYEILLDSTHKWTKETLAKAVAYHVGYMLGMPPSKEPNSVMYPYLSSSRLGSNNNDSLSINLLYPKPCKNADFRYLPITTQVKDTTLVKLLLDKKGTIKVTASGQIYVGLWLGYSTPDGIDKGLFNFPIIGYNTIPGFNHAVLMYKLNYENEWHSCGHSCEIPVDNVGEYIELLFDINSNAKQDDVGAYNVNLDYK